MFRSIQWRSGRPRRSRACLVTGVVALALFCAPALSGCSESNLTYSGEPISGRVVDAETGKPLEGVNVVSAWHLVSGPGQSIVGYIAVSEDVTDREGRFHFPGWGPSRSIHNGGVSDSAPHILFLKRGYVSKVTDTYKPTGSPPRPPLHMKADQDGKTIELKAFSGTPAEYAQTFSLLRLELNNLLWNDQCNWKAIPRFLWSAHLEHQMFQSYGIEVLYPLESLDLSDQRNRARCGSLADFVRGHLK